MLTTSLILSGAAIGLVAFAAARDLARLDEILEVPDVTEAIPPTPDR